MARPSLAPVKHRWQRLRCLLGKHRRSRKARERGADGLVRSVCEGCGVRMVRSSRSGEWLVHGNRDRRRQTRWLRRWLEQMTGPVLFLMGLALLLGLTIWFQNIDVLGADDPLAEANLQAQRNTTTAPKPANARRMP